jgi:HAD superfamily hydrolase (TIGR01549 family)
VLEAVLFDLDDTLLGNDIRLFLKHYFPLLAGHMDDHIEPEFFVAELMHGTQAMIANRDRSQTNQDVFWSVFCQRTGLERAVLEPDIDRFYREEFGRLRQVTKRRPVAAELVSFCFDRGLRVAIATNPLFPCSAIEQRLAWAGLPVDRFRFDLITSYENIHAAKPCQAYYAEILARLEVEPGQALMVGDDWANDISPAIKHGLYTYWISADCGQAPEPGISPDGCGSLDELYGSLRGGWLLARG